MRSWATLLLVVVGAGLAGAQDRPAPADPDLSADEKLLLQLLNDSRAKEKLPPLRVNSRLMKVARAHSANMAKQEMMAHVLDGKKPAQRVDDAGYDYRSVGENVAYSESDAPVPLADIHDGWMKSKVHRDNILATKFEEVGLGLARNAKSQVYYTQVFGTHRKNR